MIDGAERELFERSVRHAAESQSGAALDAALEELGWADALSADRRLAVSVLFEWQGRANTTSAALDRVLATALGLGDQPLVLPALGGWAPPAHDDNRDNRDGPDGLVAVRGLITARRIEEGAVIAIDGNGAGMVIAAGELTARPVGGADPSLGLAEVTATVRGGERRPAKDWAGAVALARLALGHELVGAARRMLELAREHALERVQFGRPIAMFQAVRHRLAETFIALEWAEAVLMAAWDDGDPGTAAMAKAMAGRGARTAARHCQQVLAGMGFTAEHPFHHYVRRVLVLDQLFGSAGTLTKDLGTELLRTRRLPPLQPL